MMKAIESSGFLDEKGILKLDNPLKVISQRVKIIILIPEEDDINDLAWLQAISSNPAFNFLNDKEEDIYSPTDGKPITNEV